MIDKDDVAIKAKRCAFATKTPWVVTFPFWAIRVYLQPHMSNITIGNTHNLNTQYDA